jgi:putative redox protein
VPSEQFDFQSPDGHRLSGALDLPDGEARTHAVFAHCFTCTKSSLAAVRIARALILRGIAVLRFDFTGLGRSGGDFADSTFSGSVRDVAAAGRSMVAVGRSPRLLIGHSLGGAAVLAAAAELPEIKAVATIGAPFEVAHVTNLLRGGMPTLLREGEAEVDIGGRPFRIRRSFVDDLAKHDQGQRIAALKRSLLVLHSPVDTVVSIENASTIFSAAKHPKSFVSLDRADHLLRRSADAQYVAEVIAAWSSHYVALRAESGERT